MKKFKQFCESEEIDIINKFPKVKGISYLRLDADGNLLIGTISNYTKFNKDEAEEKNIKRFEKFLSQAKEQVAYLLKKKEMGYAETMHNRYDLDDDKALKTNLKFVERYEKIIIPWLKSLLKKSN